MVPRGEETVSWFLAVRLDPRFFSFRMAQEFDEMESYRAGQVTMEYLPDGSALKVLVRACDETPVGFRGRLRSGSCRTDSSGHCSVLKGSYVLGTGRCLPCGSSLEALRISRD